MGFEVAAWDAPGPVEQQLYEAIVAGDCHTYLEILSENELLHGQPEGVSSSGEFRGTYWEPLLQAECLAFQTLGMYREFASDKVYVRADLGSLAANWPESIGWLAINPGTPCAAFFGTAPVYRALWPRRS
ncbi:hypothetical protein [Nocardia heshunensis]